TDEAPAEELLPTWDVQPPPAIPLAEAGPAAAVPVEAVPVEAVPVEAAAEPAPILCPVCQSPHFGKNPYCSDCGYYFSPAELAAATTGAGAGPVALQAPAIRLQDRFEVGAKVSERHGVERFRGLDHAASSPTPVWILREALPPV